MRRQSTKPTTDMKTAVIDVGSNSVRLMLVDGEHKIKRVTTTQLGRGLQKTGRLSDDRIEETLQAIGEFIKLSGKSYVFATEAVRASANGKEFCDKVYNLYGVKVDVLNKEEEAKAGFLGATQGRMEASIIDIGGASTEFATNSDKGFNSVSLPLGAVRLTDKRLDGEDTLKYVEEFLPKFEFCGEVFGIGGTITSVVLMAQNLERYEVEKVHGYKLTEVAVSRLLKSLEGLTGKEIYATYPVIGEKRSGVIYEGIKLLSLIMTNYRISSITVSDSDNTEGYLLLRNL